MHHVTCHSSFGWALARTMCETWTGRHRLPCCRWTHLCERAWRGRGCRLPQQSDQVMVVVMPTLPCTGVGGGGVEHWSRRDLASGASLAGALGLQGVQVGRRDSKWGHQWWTLQFWPEQPWRGFQLGGVGLALAPQPRLHAAKLGRVVERPVEGEYIQYEQLVSKAAFVEKAFGQTA